MLNRVVGRCFVLIALAASAQAADREVPPTSYFPIHSQMTSRQSEAYEHGHPCQSVGELYEFEFQFSHATGLAALRLGYIIDDLSEAQEYRSYALTIPGLAFDRATSEIIHESGFSGRVACAKVKGKKVTPTGHCRVLTSCTRRVVNDGTLVDPRMTEREFHDFYFSASY